MNYFGEIVALFVAFSWTLTALFFEFAGNRIGSLTVNLLRLLFSALMLGIILWIFTGDPFAAQADRETWLWMSLSGAIGFVFGDFCLFYSYTLISARFSQLFMTLAPPFAALFGWVMLGERLSFMGYVGMLVTLIGIAISVLTRVEGEKKYKIKLPTLGVLLAVGGALGQGLGIVTSKVGMMKYTAVATTPKVISLIPFAATQIRVLTGIIGFLLIITLTKRLGNISQGVKDKRAIAATFWGSIFGPVVGVSLSLMAVQYTNTAVASTIMATTPILILLPYRLFYKKRIAATEVLGAVISVVGVSLLFMRVV